MQIFSQYMKQISTIIILALIQVIVLTLIGWYFYHLKGRATFYFPNNRYERVV